MTFIRNASWLVLGIACLAASVSFGQEDASMVRSSGIIPVESLKGYEKYVRTQGQEWEEHQVALRMGRIYAFQGEVLEALAFGENTRAGAVLDRAILALERLASRSSLHNDRRFQELYRSVVTEYERHYGSLDPAMEMVAGLRSEMFTDEPAAFAEDAETVYSARAIGAPLQTRVPMPLNNRVRNTIAWFLQNRRENLERWMTRSDTYFPMISKVFAEEGVPDELKYLSVVESALQPAVVSSAKAAGMWQFMSATGKAYGLKIDSWVDERMDPEKATRAAAKHLKDLYRMYGNDWHVALAGYNCSPRCIQRAIRRAGGSMKNIPSYWDFLRYLPRETQGYLPQYIAVAHIMSNPTKYGFARAPIGAPLAYETVTVRGKMDLAQLADMAGTDEETLKSLNSELKRGTTPPGQHSYRLRLPPNHAARFQSVVAARVSDTTVVPKAIRYRVRRGDTLGRIAESHGVGPIRHTDVQWAPRIGYPSWSGTGNSASSWCQFHSTSRFCRANGGLRHAGDQSVDTRNGCSGSFEPAGCACSARKIEFIQPECSNHPYLGPGAAIFIRAYRSTRGYIGETRSAVWDDSTESTELEQSTWDSNPGRSAVKCGRQLGCHCSQSSTWRNLGWISEPVWY